MISALVIRQKTSEQKNEHKNIYEHQEVRNTRQGHREVPKVKNKLSRIVTVLFVLFGLSGAGSIADFYYSHYPLIFTKINQSHDTRRSRSVGYCS